MERRTKNSGLRKGPHLNSWIWCMFIKVFCLPCIFSECFGNNITLSVQPPGDRRIFYGDPLEIFCVAEGGSVAKDLELLVNNVKLSTTIVNNTTIRWYENRPEKQSTTFYCNNKRTNKKCSSKVVVDGYPQEVKVFTCLSKNLNELNCSWEFPKGSQMVVNYTLTFLVNNRPMLPCKVHDEQNVSWCEWTTKSSLGVPLYRQQLEIYDFNLTSCNSFGCIHQNFTIDHFSVVKPDPPTALEVLHNDSHSVTIQWKISNNMVDLLKGGVDHRIEYQISEIDNTKSFHMVDASDLPPKNRTYKYELNLPYAHWEYEVRIYIKPKKAKLDKYWSDYAFIMINTTSEMPPRPPKIAAGSFQQQSYVNHRLIKIYWSQLSDVEEAGANFTYRIDVSQGNKQQTLFPEQKSFKSYVSLNASAEPMHVMVWSENSVGRSPNYSSLYIPSEDDTKNLRVRSFTKHILGDGINELSWTKIPHNKIDNYTLFWCELNTTQTCTGRMNFTTLPPNASKHSLDLPTSTLYQFAISANKGLKSSGMTWASCEISKEGMEWYQIPVMLTHNSVGTTHVNLIWEVPCTFTAGFLRGYIIYYCPVIDTTASCHGNVNNSQTIENPNIMNYKVENLLPYTTYQFTIALNTSSGVRQHNNTDRVTTLEDTPSKPMYVKIKDITHNSVNITWDEPEHRNGKNLFYNITKTSNGITNYVIEDSQMYRQVDGLEGLTNYTFAVKACNYNAKNHCSSVDLIDEIFVRTRIGPPGKINSAPIYNNSMASVQWSAPGQVDRYQVRILKDKKDYEMHNTTELSVPAVYCEGDEMSYQVRAINVDADWYHGVLGDPDYVERPERIETGEDEYVGEWSQTYNMPCQSGGLTLTLIILGVFLVVGVGYGSLKLYKKMKQMEDIKPVFPNGLNVPEKDLTKYGFGGWTQANKDEKPSSDEMLLLPNSKTSVSPVSPSVKQSIDNCDSSDHTDSTALSNNSQAPIDRQSSISDSASDSSLHLDMEQGRDESGSQGDASVSETESSRENSPYLNDQAFKKNPVSGYVQSVINPNTDASSPLKSPHAKSPTQPASSSYVMAGLPQPIFTTGLLPASPPPAGYVRADDPQARLMNLPKLGPSPTKLFGPESLPTLPLPSPKKGEDSSYIQLQCLESLPNLKVREQPVSKPTASGYVSPGDAVLNKHLNNMMAARAPVPDTPILLDPDMSPDAYCRFSWSKDPSIDNFNSILVDSSLTSPKN